MSLDAHSGPLRVALVSFQKAWYGGEQQALLLAEGLRERGHDVRLAVRGQPIVEAFSARDFEVLRLRKGYQHPATLWRLRSWLRRWRPDVLHMNDAHAVIGAGLAALGGRIGARIAARRVTFPIRHARPYVRFCDRLLCVSPQVAAVCHQSGIPSSMTAVVPDGLEPARLESGSARKARRSLGLAAEELLLLVVARLTSEKGHEDLLHALPEVLAAHPRLRVAFAGDGPLEQRLGELAERLGIAGRVTLLGYRPDVPDLLAACHLLVLPSREEGLGTSLMDAMYVERPIVATSAGGIPWLLQPDEAGRPMAWLAEPSSPSSLAASLHLALADPEEARQRSLRAAQRVRQQFLAQHMVEATLALYREVLTTRRGRMPDTRVA